MIEGVLTVLVLYRAVRRWRGAGRGHRRSRSSRSRRRRSTLNRGNVADTLLVLLLVLAADALIAALHTGKRIHLVLAGVWVGLAFQAKMLEAWLILPALFTRRSWWRAPARSYAAPRGPRRWSAWRSRCR